MDDRVSKDVIENDGESTEVVCVFMMWCGDEMEMRLRTIGSGQEQYFW
jgi:hypothetical protein